MNKKNNQEEKNLMNRWVFDHAYAMMDEFNMNRSEAFRRAHLARELVVALGQGVVTFQYEKQDGTLREAEGTLCKGVDVAFDNHVYADEKVEQNYATGSTNFTYWDLEKHGFRTFSALRIVKIIAVVIPNYKEHELHESHESHELIEFV